MNKEIIIGFLNEHNSKCRFFDVSNCIKTNKACTFCYYVNRDISLLLTHIKGARKTVDVGLALYPNAQLSPYEPYKIAGFQVFYQKGDTEAKRIKSIFEETFNQGYDSIIALSHSVPNLPINYLELALSELRKGNNLVLGPSENGMFYLIGMNRVLFNKIYNLNHNLNHDQFNKLRFTYRSLGENTLGQIRENFSDYSMLPTWYILKTINDLKKLYRDSQLGIGWKAQWTHLFAQELFD